MDTLLLAVTVLAQGLLSFLSPCVLPVVPLYLGYLAGDAGAVLVEDTDGPATPSGASSRRRRLVVNAVAFCIGVSCAFFVLGMGASALGRALSDSRSLLATIGGIVVIVLGLWQIFLYGRGTALDGSRRLGIDVSRLAMSPGVAFLMGFAFSFAWTPCVGPALTSVLLMTASQASAAAGFVLIALYAAGFCIPFLVVALMADKALAFFATHRKALGTTVKLGGCLLVVMGVLMVGGYLGTVSSSLASSGVQQSDAATTSATAATTKAPADAAPDFTLVDLNGETHTLSEYRGKVVLLNFWATWCGYCTEEMPDIQALYDYYEKNTGDVVILGVANPKDDSHPGNSDVSQNQVESFLTQHDYTYPVLMDTTHAVFSDYAVWSFPKTVVIGKDGTIAQTIAGATERAIMNGAIKQALSKE